MNTPRFAALYCRLSKSKEASIESNSIANQKSACLRTAQMYGYEHMQFFIDDGYSGSDFKRPALKDMEAAIVAGVVSVVIAKDISRLGRNYLKVGQYIEQFFPKYDVRFISVTGEIDSNTDSANLLPIYSVMDEWYARDISRKLRTMYQTRAAQGIPIGTPVYGYVRSKDNPQYWEVDPEASSIIKKIFQLALEGNGCYQIASQLEEERILTPAHYRAFNGRNAGNRMNPNPYKWAQSTVSQILRRQEYCGDVVNKKTYSRSFKNKTRFPNPPSERCITKDVHIPIIERSTWELVQQNLSNGKAYKRKANPSLFSGFLSCGDCGSNLHYHFNQNNPAIEYYNCSNYVGNRGACSSTHYVRLDFLESEVLEAVNQLLQYAHKDLDRFDCNIEKYAFTTMMQQKEELQQKLHILTRRNRELKALLARLYEEKIKGDIVDNTFLLLANEFKGEMERNISHSQKIQEIIQRNQYLKLSIDNFKKAIRSHEKIEQLTRELLYEFIERIDVYQRDTLGKAYTQKIDISFHHIRMFGSTKQAFFQQKGTGDH